MQPNILCCQELFSNLQSHIKGLIDIQNQNRNAARNGLKILCSTSLIWIALSKMFDMIHVGRTITRMQSSFSRTLHFLWIGATCACLWQSGKVDDDIHKFTNVVIGLVMLGLAICSLGIFRQYRLPFLHWFFLFFYVALYLGPSDELTKWLYYCYKSW